MRNKLSCSSLIVHMHWNCRRRRHFSHRCKISGTIGQPISRSRLRGRRAGENRRRWREGWKSTVEEEDAFEGLKDLDAHQLLMLNSRTHHWLSAEQNSHCSPSPSPSLLPFLVSHRARRFRHVHPPHPPPKRCFDGSLFSPLPHLLIVLLSPLGHVFLCTSHTVHLSRPCPAVFFSFLLFIHPLIWFHKMFLRLLNLFTLFNIREGKRKNKNKENQWKTMSAMSTYWVRLDTILQFLFRVLLQPWIIPL